MKDLVLKFLKIFLSVTIGMLIGITVDYVIAYKWIKDTNKEFVEYKINKNRQNLITDKKTEKVYKEVISALQKELDKENIDIDIKDHHPKLIIVKSRKFDGFFCSNDYSENFNKDIFGKFFLNINILSKNLYKNANGFILLHFPGQKYHNQNFDAALYNILMHELTHFIMFKYALYNNKSVDLFNTEYAPSLIVSKFGKDIDKSYYKTLISFNRNFFKGNFFGYKKTLKKFPKTDMKLYTKTYINTVKNIPYMYLKNRGDIKHGTEYINVILAFRDLNRNGNLKKFNDKPFKYIISKEKKYGKILDYADKSPFGVYFYYLLAKKEGLVSNIYNFIKDI